MLRELKLSGFTAFADVHFTFAPGLNIVVGENGTGKTHVLKAAYSAISMSAQGNQESGLSAPTKSYVQSAMAKKLLGVFKPDSLGRLVRRNRRSRQGCEVDVRFNRSELDMAFSFKPSSKSEVTVEKSPSAWIDKLPVYLPTRELLTIYPGFVSLYETTQLPFELTWRDTCILLGAPLARGPRSSQIKSLLQPLEQAMGGNVVLDDNGGFYLNVAGVNREMHLVAEGFRKLAMIARLIATGSLVEKGYLFWDEPEANLNPKMIKLLAPTIVHLCRSGIQMVIATHSLFLLRELEILLRAEDANAVEARFFGLHWRDDAVEVAQGDSIDDIGDIASLEEELTQSDRFLATERRA